LPLLQGSAGYHLEGAILPGSRRLVRLCVGAQISYDLPAALLDFGDLVAREGGEADVTVALKDRDQLPGDDLNGFVAIQAGRDGLEKPAAKYGCGVAVTEPPENWHQFRGHDQLALGGTCHGDPTIRTSA